MIFTKKQLQEQESLFAWQQVVECLKQNVGKDYFDRIELLQKRYSIRINKCKCTRSAYDINGYCVRCELKISDKQIGKNETKYKR